MMRQLKAIKGHVICWAIFISYEVFVAYTYTNKFSNFFDYVGSYTLNIGLFYFNTYITFERSFQRKKYVFASLTLFILLEILLYLCLKRVFYFIYIYCHINSIPYSSSNGIFAVESIWRATYFIGLSIGYWFFISSSKQFRHIANLEKQKLISELEKEQLEKDLLITENILLKSQINPHFLFNVLGFMHHSISKFSRESADALILLSDMMRYALNKQTSDGLVLLEEEIEQIDNYIQINQYRFNKKLNIIFTYNDGSSGIKIIPLLFITIVENVFKYGELMDENNPAKIDVDVVGNKLTLVVSNKKNSRHYGHSTGIGMSNVTKRLNLHYKNKFKLEIDDSLNQYHLTLSIDI